MGTMVLRSQDCLQNPLPADAFRSCPPPRSRREVSRRPQTRPPHRRTELPAKAGPVPASQPPHSSEKNPFRSPNNRGRRAAPVRRCRTPENHRQVVVKLPVKELVMEEVTILRRGQAVWVPPRAAEDRRPLGREGNAPAAVAAAAGGDDLELCPTARLGPEPEILPKQIRIMDQKPHLYAGSGFFTSPPPSSLPLPTSFLSKKDVADTADLATRNLRCLLRLDLLP